MIMNTFIDKIYSVLDFEHRVVGVQLIKTKKEYENIQAIEPSNGMNYCGMVKAACKGHSLKGGVHQFKCKSAPRVLGLDPSDEKNSKGETWNRLGLYCNFQTSQSVREELTYLKEPSYGVLIQPIELFDHIPDVSLFLTNSYNAMRILQGYTYSYGIAKNIQLVGNQAICYESTARVIHTQDINISLLCIGTRHRSGWTNTELCISLHKSKFIETMNGVFNTVNQMENNTNKRKIETKLKQKDIADFEIQYNNNYYNNV